MKGFLLAAGYGTRMGELTRDLPKPLLPVGGYPLIYYSLFWLWKWGASEAIINLHYLGEKIEEKLSNFSHFPLHFVYEEKILGTAGGIRNCIGRQLSSNEGFVLLNPDTILVAEAMDSPAHIIEGTSEIHRANLQTTMMGASKKSIDTETSRSCILGLKERKYQNFSGITFPSPTDPQIRFSDKGDYYYMGYSILQTQELLRVPAFADGSESELGPVWKALAEEGRLQGFSFSGKIFDAGTKESYLAIHKHFPLPKALYEDWEKFLKGIKG